MTNSATSYDRIQQLADGSKMVFCRECKEAIGPTMSNITTATCELCRRVAAGETLTPELIEIYNRSKGRPETVTALMLAPDPSNVKRESRFTFRSLGSTVVRAAGIVVEKTPVLSQIVAKTKRRGRLLGNIRLGSDGEETK
jgi:hypothetical protein